MPDSRRRIWIDATKITFGGISELNAAGSQPTLSKSASTPAQHSAGTVAPMGLAADG